MGCTGGDACPLVTDIAHNANVFETEALGVCPNVQRLLPQGGWQSTAHTRYERFTSKQVLGLAAAMVNEPDPYETSTTVRQREVVRAPQVLQRGEESAAGLAQSHLDRESSSDSLSSVSSDARAKSGDRAKTPPVTSYWICWSGAAPPGSA